MINQNSIAETRPAQVAERAVLLLAPTGRDAQLTADMLRRAELPCVVCHDAAQLIDRMSHGYAPALIVTEALNPEHAANLEQILAHQPPWSDPPVILLAGGAPLPPCLTALIDRASTTVLHRPLKIASLTSTVRAALHSRLRQYEARDMLRALENRAAQLQKLALELVETEERERQRVAQLLHDDLQQVLAGAKLHVAMLPSRARQDQLESATTALSLLLDEAMEKSRNLSHELSPPVLQQHGLPVSLKWLAQRMHRLHRLQVEVSAQPAANPEDDRVRVFLFRCAQELLFNVVKHAGVKQASLDLSLHDGSVALRVSDAGKGVDLLTLHGPTAGLGLASIRERTKLLGGHIEVKRGENAGTIITLTLPLEPAVPPVLPRSLPPHPTEIDGTMPEPDEPDQVATRLRIVLVDDHRVMRSGLRSLLDMEQDIEVVGEADDGLQAIEMADQLLPDLILMDVSMPRMDGVEATRRIKARHPAIRVIGLSMSDDEQSAVKMRSAGAHCYLSKAGAARNLLKVVRSSLQR